MENGGSIILARLLDIKVRRERSLRAALAALAQHEIQLLEKKTKLIEERHQVWEEWREYSNFTQTLDRNALHKLKQELANYCGRDQHLVEQLAVWQNEWNQLQIDKAEQQTLLQKVRVEQTKLEMLINNVD
jgi:hypothetical protein